MGRPGLGRSKPAGAGKKRRFYRGLTPGCQPWPSARLHHPPAALMVPAAMDSPVPPPPATPADLFARLDRLGIAYKTHEHPPLFTVEDSKKLRGELPGGHCKN